MNTDQTPKRTHARSSAPPHIWVDLDNSPHVPFFAPIIEELKRRGCSITLTARDAYQVHELADMFQLTYKSIGHHWGKHNILKVLGTCLRALQLVPIILREKPDLAVAHGSRSQTIASSLLKVPSLLIFDYEFASAVGFFRPTWSMTPDVIPLGGSHQRMDRVLHYPGIKEDVYVPTFKPDPTIRSRLRLDERKVVVVVRPPASEAHYHVPKSDELFATTIEFLGNAPDVQVILLPRNHKQAEFIRNSWPRWFADGRLFIPEHAEDGLNLIWHSDLVISGGGTMNREAAALGIPVYSIFQGPIGAVDRYLSNNGRLVLLTSAEDVRAKISLVKRVRPAMPHNTASTALMKIADSILSLAASSNARRGWKP